MLPDGTGAFFVDFVVDEETQAFKADKTNLEVYNAVKSGCLVYARMIMGNDVNILPLYNSGLVSSTFLAWECALNSGNPTVGVLLFELMEDKTVNISSGGWPVEAIVA